jgi:streptogramin lyase
VALKKEPLPKNAIELKLEYSFPNDEQVKNDIYIASGRDICIDREDHIYVSDWKAAKILEFDFKGNFLKAFGRKGQGPGEYTSPGHLFCDPKNNLLIDGQNHQILTFDPNGKFVKSLKTTKSHTGYAIDADGRIENMKKRI